MVTGDRPFSDPDTHCQEEICVENVQWAIVPKTWCLPCKTSRTSGCAANSSDSGDFYPSPNFSERKRISPAYICLT